MKGHKLTIETGKEFIFGGKAIFTIKNEKTGNRFTFKLRKKDTVDPNNPVFFVSVLAGSDNDNSYSFLGTIFNKTRYSHSVKSKISSTANSAKVFDWFFKHLTNGTLPEYISMFHEGKCAQCGRTLTVPESIISGFGPECSRRRSENLKYKERQLRLA